MSAVAVVAVGVLGAALALDATPASAEPPALPPAATRPEPVLPAPAAWPFDESFPRTSGTGRHAGGAYLWTDFLYDDNGAVGADAPFGESAGAPTFGTYAYPDDAHAGNGADVFRAGVGLTGTDTWWRVDWNTLVDAAVPVAAFGIDVDGGGGAAVAWPANAGVRTAGLDLVLVVSSRSARLLDTDGAVVGTGEVTVDMAARSFVVRLPRSVLDPTGTSTVHLAAGLAGEGGEGFRSLGPQHRHLPGQANVYNLAFRDYDDEPAANNFWFDTTQATTLTPPSPDVTAFAATVDWRRLAAGEREPEPWRTGWSNRWYVSSVELGQGRTDSLDTTADSEPNYLGRVQPYGVWVPTGAQPGTALPLTWLLHSFTINHNQYAATTPDLVARACEDRGSICATTLGRGPDGFYEGPAELDFWEVWRDLDEHLSLDPERTLIGGYSMGGFGAFRFALNHPDLFAGMFILASAAGDDLPRLENARWTPYYHAHGVLDQLVPYLNEALPTVDELDRLGYRLRFDTYPTKDHIAWSLEDGLYLAAEWMAEEDRVVPPDPGHLTYRWFPADLDADAGFGPTGAWWVGDLLACDPAQREARVDAVSLGILQPAVEPQRTATRFVDENGNPVDRREITWALGPAAAAEPSVTLDLDNVGRATVDLARAGVRAEGDAAVAVDTTCPVALTLSGVRAGTPVLLDGQRVAAAPPGGAVTVDVPAGEHRITFSAAAGPGDGAGPQPAGRLPATGPGAGPIGAAAAAVVLGLALLARRLIVL